MSYCVNCGVELGGGLVECPLCNTPVRNPNEIEKKNENPAFPTEKGQAEPIKKKDMWLLLTIMAVVTSVTCVLLNVLVYGGYPWSLAIVGACALIWVMLLPAVVHVRMIVYLCLLLDGVMLAVYLYMITYMTPSQNWFWQLGLPIVLVVVTVAELFAVCVRKISNGFLPTTLYTITAIGMICGGLEILIDHYLGKPMVLRWSAIVLTVCIIINATIITLLSVKRFREEIRRRLHF